MTTDSAAPATPRQIQLQRIFLKDASLELPHAPQIFTLPWNPQVDVQMSTAINGVEQDVYQVVLSGTVTAKLGEQVAFLAEAHQAGIFYAPGFAPAELQAVLAGFCPNALFPYLREAISTLVMHAGFPPIVLQPVNFDALYAEHLMRAQAEASAANQIVQ